MARYSTPERRLPYERFIEEAGRRSRVSPNLIRAIISQESGWNPRAISYKRDKQGKLILDANGQRIPIAYGLMQVTPGASGLSPDQLLDPKANIDAGTDIIAAELTKWKGDEELALAAYNCGTGFQPGQEAQLLARYRGPCWYETGPYVSAVFYYWDLFSRMPQYVHGGNSAAFALAPDQHRQYPPPSIATASALASDSLSLDWRTIPLEPEEGPGLSTLVIMAAAAGILYWTLPRRLA